MVLKDSEKREEIQALHTEWWNELQHCDEAFAVNFMTNCLKSLKERQMKRNTLKNFVTTRVLDFGYCWFIADAFDCHPFYLGFSLD